MSVLTNNKLSQTESYIFCTILIHALLKIVSLMSVAVGVWVVGVMV